MTEWQVVQLGDTAGVPLRLREGLERRGVPARTVVPPTPLAGAPGVVKAASLPVRLAWARRFVRRSRSVPTVLHVHYATAAVSFIRSGMPLVVHAHGTDVRHPSRPVAMMLRAVWGAADLRLVATPDLVELVPGAIYLPNPIDADRFATAGASIEPTSDVLVFAALTEVKGAARLVEAVRLLVRRRPGVSVTALAGGPYESAMRAAGATIVRRRTAHELPALIAAHRVVLGQQLLGALGVSELEAMATARPVIVHLRADLDHGVRPPVLVESDAATIATRALDLLDDPDRAAATGRESAAWVQARHGTDRVVERLLGLYREHLGISWPDRPEQ